ncbi:MAG: M14 family zinc carboxypeptidase [Christensenellales bacterium]|jgi:hypothetical protein
MKRILFILIIAAVLIVTGYVLAASADIPSEISDKPTDINEIGIAGMKTFIPERKITDAVDSSQTYSYEQMLSDAQTLKTLYPDLIGTKSIGKSVEGRDILLIKFGKGEKKILLLGAHHAREYISSTFLMETVDQYAQGYACSSFYGSYDIKALLDQVTVYIVPMINPDGVNLVQNGIDSVKDPKNVKSMRMLQDSYDKWKANINGVDLNRQYPCHWDEKESNTDVPSSEKFKGYAPATEPEVKAIMALCNDNAFILAASLHTKGEVIYWADSGTNDVIEAGSSMAETLSDVTGYKLMPVSEDPAVYGAGFENWFRQEFARPAFCVELTPVGNGATPHEDKDFETLIWDKAKYLCVTLIARGAESSL